MSKPFFKFDPDLGRLFRYLLPYRARIALATVFLFGTASTSSLTATLLGKLTDIGFYEQQSWVIVAAPLALIGVTLIFAVCTVMSSYVMAKVSQGVLVTLRTEMFRRVLRWPTPEYQDMGSGMVGSKFVNEATVALGGATQSVIILVRDSVQVLALLGVLFWHNWQLTLVTFIVIPGLAVILRLISKKVRVIVSDSQENVGRMISRVQESYSAERIVKVANAYAFEDERFATVNDRIKKLAMKTIKYQSLATPLTQMLTMVAVGFVVGFALLEAQKGLLTVGEFITFLSAMLLMKAPIQHLAGLNATFSSMAAAAKSLFDMLDRPAETDNGTQTLERAQGQLNFEHVTLRYPGQTRDAVHDVSFSVKKGEHVALVGMSGSGKTSLVNLVPRFWALTQGRILLDGIDIEDLTLESLRRQLSVVSQKVILFDDSIRNNICYGCEGVTEEAMNHAIDAAALRSFIDSLPRGVDTCVGECGNLLSGGQKQRLSIARSLLKNAPILILDEATSALDSESENLIKNELDVLMQGRTTLTVAHRLSTIRNADRIVVMDQGEIIETGTHDELIVQNGSYANLCRIQGLS